MTVSTAQNRIVYDADGVQTVFTYPFLAYTNDSIKVYFGADNQQLAGFTVNRQPDNIGGNVTFAIAPADAVGTVTIVRIEDLDQETDLVPYDKFPSQVIERSFDKLTMICQQLSDTIARSLTAPINDPLGVQLVIPPFNTRLGKVLAFDEVTGNPIASTFTLAELENAQQEAADAVIAAQLAASQASASAVAADASEADAEAAAVQAVAAAALLNGAAVPMFAVEWWPGLRTAIPAGRVAADGQMLLRSLFVDAWAGMATAMPMVSDATWLSTLTERGKYTAGDGSTTFRVPDYNGKFAGSLGAVLLRGDGTLSAAVTGVIQRDQMQQITGSLDPRNSATAFMEGASPGALRKTGASVGAYAAGGGSTGGGVLEFDSSLSPGARTGTETRPLNVTGCWTIRLFGTITNAGAADAAALATAYANLASRVTTLESQRRAYSGSPVNVTGFGSLVLGPVPVGARRIRVYGFDLAGSAVGATSVRAHIGGVAQTANYAGTFSNHQASAISTAASATDEFWVNPNNVATLGTGSVVFTKTVDAAGAATWIIESNFAAATGANVYDARGKVVATGDISHIELRRVNGAQTFTGGSAVAIWE